MKHQQSGFTLIELIIVIVLLGILAAVAVPRFVDLSPGAYQAARDGAEGGLKAARVIKIAELKRNPTVAELAAAMDPAGTAAVASITFTDILDDDGVTQHAFPTYSDAACSVLTTAGPAPANLVACVQE